MDLEPITLRDTPVNWRWRADPVAGPCVVFDLDGVLSDAVGRQHLIEWPQRDWYAFFDAPGERPVALVRGRSEPARITTSFGLETVYSRALTLLVFASLLAACIGAAGSVLWKGLLARRAFARMSGMLSPAPA